MLSNAVTLHSLFDSSSITLFKVKSYKRTKKTSVVVCPFTAVFFVISYNNDAETKWRLRYIRLVDFLSSTLSILKFSSYALRYEARFFLRLLAELELKEPTFRLESVNSDDLRSNRIRLDTANPANNQNQIRCFTKKRILYYEKLLA